MTARVVSTRPQASRPRKLSPKPSAEDSPPPEHSSATADAPPTTPTSLVSQRDQAYRGLRRLLILQKLPEGQRLREPHWAAQLGVNRMALREAFARLEAEGLIARGPRTGYFVPQLTDEDIRDILEVRTIIECGAIDLLCKMAPRPLKKRLEPLVEACDELESLIRKSYLLGASEADRRFHEALIDAAGNPRLGVIYHRAPLPMIHRQIIATDRWAFECQRTLAEHRDMIAAIKKGHPDHARTIMRQHLSERYLLPIPG